MTGLINYTIETRHPITGYWKVQRECLCNYELEEYVGRFLFWKKIKSRIINQREEELRCLVEVMTCRCAYEKEHEDVRVRRSYCIDNRIYKNVIWKNGRWKDWCHQLRETESQPRSEFLQIL